MSATGTSSWKEELLQAAEKLLDGRNVVAANNAFCLAEQAGADPDRCSAGLWTANMLAGNFREAWQQSDTIRRRGGRDPHRFWNGEAIEGKPLIVRCLHGLGDAVQMLRYLPALQSRCAHLTLEVPPRLLSLASFFSGVDEVITWGQDAPSVPPVWDIQVEIMELPYLFRTGEADLPIAREYLRLPVEALQTIAQRMGSHTRPRVGIVWSASEWDPTRCLPADCLRRLVSVSGVEFWNLQGGEQHDLREMQEVMAATRDAAAFGDGLVPLACVIANMDLVLTVDTLAAHMAGAMGEIGWVLLQHRADWRWMHGREDSPWYPTLRLWRQPALDDWEGLTVRVCDGLERWREGKQ